jgi:hypothetical protein
VLSLRNRGATPTSGNRAHVGLGGRPAAHHHRIVGRSNGPSDMRLADEVARQPTLSPGAAVPSPRCNGGDINGRSRTDVVRSSRVRGCANGG